MNLYKINYVEEIKDMFLKFKQQLLIIRMSTFSSPNFFGGNCFLSVISFMAKQKLSLKHFNEHDTPESSLWKNETETSLGMTNF